MKRVDVASLRAGMQFTEPVYVDDNNILVPAEVEIRQKDIDRLQKWNIDAVTTEGTVVSPETQLHAVAANTSGEQTGDSRLQELFAASVKETNRFFAVLGSNQAVQKTELESISDKLLAATVEASDDMLAFVLRNERSNPSIGLSAVNTVILSVLVGRSLRMDAARLKTLATSALLHDVGMVRVPGDIVRKTANLSAYEINRVRAHTLFSYQIISKELGFPEEIALVALQHHERWDGKGYPRKIAEKSIAVEARIVAVVDAFEAMVKDRPYRNSMISYAAMRQLLNDNSKHFDSEILRVFIKSVGIYPLGSFVILNNGGIGRVIKVNEHAPLRPTIRLLVDKTGKKFEDDKVATLDLTTETEIFIARAIDPKMIANKKMA